MLQKVIEMATQPNNGTCAPTRPVGPDYRSESQKPAATVSTPVDIETVTVLPQTPQLIALLTSVVSPPPPPKFLPDRLTHCRIIRDKNTDRGDFIFYSNRIIRLLVEEGLN